jgi:chaperonin GroES
MGAQSGQGTEPQFQVEPYVPEPEEPEDENELAENEQVRQQEKALHRVNIAERLDDDELEKIGMEVKVGYQADLDSMADWLKDNEDWLKLAKQVREEKTFPFPKASNIKYPLISTAALQFSARAYPTLVPADGKLVKTKLWGKDPSGEKAKKGNRIGTFMSWQLVEEMKNWEEDMDKLLIMNAVVGQSYKKTYYDPKCEHNVSCFIYPENFVIDYWAKSIEDCKRYSEIHEMTKQDVLEYKLRKFFLDVDIGQPTNESARDRYTDDGKKHDMPVNDFTSTYNIIEQHTWLDLDGDDLREPYIVWFELISGKILRIQARFDAYGIQVSDDNEVVGYKDKVYYTKFGFIPNPDGSFFDIGFGQLIGPLNEAVNTNLNQLTDSGTLQNLQSGFIAKGLRLNMADTSFKMGEWKAVNATGDDLRKLIVPLPSKEPSPVLFQLLGMLIQSGKELASVAEIFTGKMPGQNTPATTTMATVEQGMKVFTAIYKRIYRSLAKEYKKLFYLNKYYLDKETYAAVLDEPIGPDDFDDEVYDVCPTADPTATTQAEKLLKAQALMELLGTGLLNPNEVIMRVLEAQEQPNWQKLIPGLAETGQPQPPQEKPDPKLLAMERQSQLKQQESAQKMANEERKSAMDQRSKEAEMIMKAQSDAEERAHKMEMLRLERDSKREMSNIFAAESRQKAILGVLEGRQKLAQNEELGKQKIQQAKEIGKSKNKTGSTGKTAK